MTNLIRQSRFTFFLFATLLTAITGYLLPLSAAPSNLKSNRIQSDIQRDKSSKPNHVIKFSGVQKGDHVLDLFAGGGYYSELFAKAVGEKGRVTLQNNKAYLPYIGVELEVRLADDRLKNVEKLISEATALKLGQEKYDLIVLVLGYHDFFYTSDKWDVTADIVMPQVIQSLKSGGKFLVIDHNATQGSKFNDSQKLHRIEANFAKHDIENRGLKFTKESSILRNSADPLNIKVFDPKIRRKTDRFVYLFEKP